MKYSTRNPFPSETFQSFDGKILTVTEDDIILVRQDGQTRPCNKQTFAETYVLLEENKWIKNEISRLVQVPEGETVSIETLEGKLNEVKHPDYIIIGKKDELYANTFEWAQNNLTFIE